ncbi:MAG: PTS galactitol transporter subunit IIC [Spirochaetes bacterium]|nr:PTS galactitol transporter subunit IIC [Spirochaetota bacterium]
MEQINSAVTYILSFKPYVMLPLLILLFSLILRIKFKIAVKAALSIGIGFIGIFLVFDYFVRGIGPAAKMIVERTGLQFNVLDVGWPPLASIAWSFKLAPVMILVIIAVNIIMLTFKLTKVINIDIWNFWHLLMVGALVYASTGSITISVISIITAEVLILKIGDFIGPYASRYSGINNITITTLSAGGYFPFGVIGNSLLGKVPFLKNLNANPENIQKKMGLAGEPVIIGFFLGLGLSIAAGYEIKQILELAFTVSAVVMILPLMCRILSEGLIPISDGMKNYMKNKFPGSGETFIGLDNAVLQGDPAVIVTGLILMPIALGLAFVLPGIRFIPIGDLVNIIALSVMIVVATNGNVIRSVIISIPIIIAHLYIASSMAEAFTNLSTNAGFSFPGYDGLITSFFDGGLIIRFWLVKFFEFNIYALSALPAVLLILFFTWKLSRNNSTIK